MLQHRRDPNIQSVWLWFEFQEHLVGVALSSILASLMSGGRPDTGTTGFLSGLVGKTPPEVREFFDGQREQLELMTMLELLTTTEAILRRDFKHRVAVRRKDGLSKRFREISKRAINDARARSARRPKIRLDGDILEAMTGEEIKVSEFRGALKLRHWLAHGRYWRPSLGQIYTPEAIFDICKALIGSISK
jgi:hypothetical protein